MNERIKKLTEYIKKPKILITIGFLGIFLIFLSSFFPNKSDKENKEQKNREEISVNEYKASLEKGIKEIVSSITGDYNATVVITMESGIRYSYADSTKADSSNSSGKESEQESSSLSQSYITVRSSDGSEQPLIITELMPKVRGVVVICNYGNDETVSEKIENAVTAALNITSNRVYISGGTIR